MDVLAQLDRRRLIHVSASPESFSATISLNGGATVVLTGELDMASAPELEQALAPVIERGPAEIVLDFSSLSFVDSSGIAVLVETQRQLSEQGRILAVSGASPTAMKVFQVTGLVDFLNVRSATAAGSPEH